jgi:hypothetical protein
MMGDEVSFDTLMEDLSIVEYGYAKPFYWVQMPDGKRNHMITRGKLVASLAVLRMNYPFIKLKQVGELPKPKRKTK